MNPKQRCTGLKGVRGAVAAPTWEGDGSMTHEPSHSVMFFFFFKTLYVCKRYVYIGTIV